MVLSRYRAASALIGSATDIVELGCGEGLGSRILIQGRAVYYGVDNDADALAVAQEMYGADDVQFRLGDAVTGRLILSQETYDAAVALDVIEHIPPEDELLFIRNAVRLLDEYGVMVIGTPSANAYHLASPQSKVGHINNYTPERLHALMARHFHTVQMLYSQGTDLHLGHPGMAHYIFATGIGPR